MKSPCVYIMTSSKNGTLYVGVTSDLVQRTWQHKNGVMDGFARKYSVHMLVYFEQHVNMSDAILREMQMKKWNRVWKLRLIEQNNPQWRDLYSDIVQ